MKQAASKYEEATEEASTDGVRGERCVMEYCGGDEKEELSSLWQLRWEHWVTMSLKMEITFFWGYHEGLSM